MGEETSIGALADAVTSRLRLLQVGLADESAENRVAALQQEMRSALIKMVPEQRRPFLEELQLRFPVFGDVATAEPSATLPQEPTDPRALAEKLIAFAAGMAPAEKQAIAERLRDAGLAIAAPALPDQEAQELTRLLQLQPPPDSRPDPARAVQLLMMLCEFVCKLDEAVWKSWAQLEPGSELRRSAPLQRMLTRFMRGEVTRPQVLQESERLLKLTASLVISLQRIGPGLFHNTFDPLRPEVVAEGIQRTMLVAREVLCWRRYEQLAAALDGGTFNAALFAAVVRVVKDFFGPAATASATQ